MLQISRQHCTNFLDITQEKSRTNIEQKDKIVRNIIIIFLCFSNHLTLRFIFFVASQFNSWEIVFTNLLRNFARVIIVFPTSLVIKEYWLSLATFCFLGTNFFKSLKDIANYYYVLFVAVILYRPWDCEIYIWFCLRQVFS